MKQKVFYGIIVFVMMFFYNVSAQDMGWYRITQHCGEDGKYIPVPINWEIYNYLFKNEGGAATMFHYRIDDTHSVFDNEVRFTCWYDTISAVKPKLGRLPKDISATRGVLYEPTDHDFKLRWYNNQPQYTCFPQNTWVTEIWSKTKPSATAEAIDELVRYYEGNDSAGLIGEWERTGCFIEGKYVKDEKRLRKTYGKNLSVLLYLPKEYSEKDGTPPMVETYGYIRRVEYISKDLTRESGNPCIIFWIDNDTHRLTCFSSNGDAIEEIWVRVSR